MQVPFVDLKAQYRSIKSELDETIQNVISDTAFIGGIYVKKFETEFADYCGVSHCIGVGNGTDALNIALRALGIGAGDEVITTAFSFIATSEAITMSGARVVFVDINPHTFNIDVTKIEEKINSSTKAIIPVHLYGQPADMDPIIDLAKKYNLLIIEDAAQAHGAEYKGRRVGTMGDIACFSFYPGKNLGAYGDGGAIVTDNDDLAVRSRMIANHGRIDKYDHEMEGVNSRLDGLQSAILSVKLKYLEQWTTNRQNNAVIYTESLEEFGLGLPIESEYFKCVYHLYVIKVDKDRRSEIQKFLKNKHIMTGIHYPIALPNLNAYKYVNMSSEDYPEATFASNSVLSLPMYPELTHNQIKYIAEQLREII